MGAIVTIQAHYNLLERDVERELIPSLRVGERRRPAVFSTGGFAHWKIYARRTASREGSRGTFSPYVKNRLTDANFDKLMRPPVR
ncbi:MAG: hypothetical protein U0X92_10650 [Anaerolineales bacterium]